MSLDIQYCKSDNFSFDAKNNLMIQNSQVGQDAPQPQPHTYLYVASVVVVLILYFILIFLCKWRKDNKGKKKPVKNELVQERIQNLPQSSDPMKKNNDIQLVEMP